MVSRFECESAPEHVRNTMALIPMTLQIEARQADPERLRVLVPVATLEAVQRRLAVALVPARTQTLRCEPDRSPSN